ncbi:hypothetical protein ACU686_22860 [Yinghuangia aomiensis]
MKSRCRCSRQRLWATCSPSTDFENGCITHVSIDDPFTPGGAVARVVVDARDREHGWPWTPVEFRLSGLRDYRIEHGKGFSGMLYFDPVVSRFADTAHGELLYLDLDPVDGPSQYEPVDAVDVVGRSQCFLRRRADHLGGPPGRSKPAARGRPAHRGRLTPVPLLVRRARRWARPHLRGRARRAFSRFLRTRRPAGEVFRSRSDHKPS